MKNNLLVLLSLFPVWAWAQVTTEPSCFSDTDEITIVYDATLGTSGLTGATKVYMHAGVITDSPTGTSWQYVVGNWGQDDGVGQMTKVNGETDKWQITLTPRSYFNVPAGTAIYRLGMVFRNEDGTKEGKTDANSDFIINLATDAVNLQITSANPLLVDTGDIVPVTATTCSNAVFNLYVNNVLETTQSGTSSFNYTYQVVQSAGSLVELKLVAEVGTAVNEQTFSFAVRSSTVAQPRPTGIIDGINYGSDPTKVTLSLWAPMKSTVYVVGDFNNWSVDPAYQMKQDGEHFWLEITGLMAGVEYAYQYLVDESIWIADPYADKVLDPDDQWIPATTYPDLMPYPPGATHANWYQNRAAVLQTNQTPYQWATTDFVKPAKEKLVMYELLVRDFLGEDNMNYQALIDTLGYIERLGANAIHLMPITEFNGNDSWGYNPTFMFAVDKAYGTKNDLKEFIDAAHGRGIAVVLDLVMNHNDIPSPYAQMYFDFSSFKPTSDNPWFNVEARHPYNVFFDINHESSYTQTWLDTITYYWLNEYRFDGFRFDLSKGYTQTNSGNDVGFWGRQDNSRIAILKRMADAIRAHTPDAYLILEHFAEDPEEIILSDYEMMLWGNSFYDYSEASMGYANGKSIGRAYYANRGWNKNNLMSYMESHDEERQMFKNLEYGNSSGNYNIKNTNTALKRLRATATFFFTVPGPKLLWQFGEFGYDVSIDENGRTGRKPTKWEYLDDPNRQAVFDTYKELIGLRKKYPVFTEGDFTWQPDGNYKSIHISKADTNVVILGNFDVEIGVVSPDFQHTGTWYDFFSGREFVVEDVSEGLVYSPGEFHIYTDKQLHLPIDIIAGIEQDIVNNHLSIYPNPATTTIFIGLDPDGRSRRPLTWVIVNALGQKVLTGEFRANTMQVDIASLPNGIYTLRLRSSDKMYSEKFIKQQP